MSKNIGFSNINPLEGARLFIKMYFCGFPFLKFFKVFCSNFQDLSAFSSSFFSRFFLL